MKCKCGSDMRLQTRGVYFCARGDYFAVVLMTPQHTETQWYRKEGEVENLNAQLVHTSSN